MATHRGDATPLGGIESASEEGAAQSTLVELTPLEWESGVPESKVDEVLTQCLTSHVPIGWVDGILRPLPSVASQPTYQGLGAGDGMLSLSDKESTRACWVNPPNKLTTYQSPTLGGWGGKQQ